MEMNKRTIQYELSSIAGLAVLAVFFAAHPASAAMDDVAGVALGALGAAVSVLLGIISLLVTSVLGLGTTLLVALLTQVAQYSNIINVPTVQNGWIIIRDICNMFFIVILLVIAFATILRKEEYSAQKLLPKLLIMAVLINFSKLIFGLAIDVSQIIMLTFVSSFKDGGGYFINMFQVDKWLALQKIDSTSMEKAINQWSTAIAIILGMIAAIITFVVVAVFLSVLVMRIIMLWIYTILSPLVFLGMAFPPIGQYTSQISKDFVKQLVVGPALGFFLWLALTTAQSSSEIMSGSLTKGSDAPLCVGVGQFFCADKFQNFIIVIGLLLGGLMVTNQIGGAAGKAAGFGEKWAKKGLSFGGKKALDNIGKPVGRAAVAGLSTADRLVGKGFDATIGRGKTNMGNKGLVNRTVQDVLNGPKNIAGSLSKKFNENNALNRERRNHYEAYKTNKDAILEHDNKKYKYAEALGKYVEWDADKGVSVFDPTTGKPKILKNKKGKDLGMMGDVQVSAWDAWNSAQSGARAASYKAQDEAIDKAQKKMADSNMDKGDMLRLLNDRATSKDAKMAAAMTLSSKGGFRDVNDVKRARDVFGANNILLDKFNDNVDKSQAHIAYDFTDKKDQDKFKERIDAGKIDSTKLDSEAFEKPEIMKLLEEHHGKDFGRIIETAFKRGKKYEESVAKGLEKSIGSHVAGLFDPVTNELDKFANSFAKLTGNVEKAFGSNSAALASYVQNTKAADLNKTKASSIDPSKPATAAFAKEFIKNISAAKLKQMHRQGDNPAVVKIIKVAMSDPSHPAHADYNKDNELQAI